MVILSFIFGPCYSTDYLRPSNHSGISDLTTKIELSIVRYVWLLHTLDFFNLRKDTHRALSASFTLNLLYLYNRSKKLKSAVLFLCYAKLSFHLFILQ